MTPGEPSVPRQVYGSSRYCSACEQRIRTSLAAAPGLVAHVLAMLGNRLPARPASDGSQRTAAASAAVPFNVQAMDDARLPEDREFRKAMRDYIHWATREVNAYAPAGTHVAPGQPMPRWSWEGLVRA